MSELEGWRFCPRCGSKVEAEGRRVHCDACGSDYYANSKPTASAVVVDDHGRVLLSRRACEPFAGKWDLPGGFLEELENPLDCLRRELREEAAIRFDSERFLGFWVDRYGSEASAVTTLNLYWSVRLAEGTPKPADDVIELRWFVAEEVPLAELAFGHIEDVLHAWRNQDA
jgi:ADP-ribose pyrophosphatase YjhB (NUDIX family)